VCDRQLKQQSTTQRLCWVCALSKQPSTALLSPRFTAAAKFKGGMFAPTGRSFSLTRFFETFVLAPVRGSS
jgi:hypothetical protein